MDPLLVTMISKGGPGLVAVVFLWLFVQERAQTAQLRADAKQQNERLLALVEKGTEAAVQHTNAISALKELLSRLAG